jgi:hypothetical protein
LHMTWIHSNALWREKQKDRVGSYLQWRESKGDQSVGRKIHKNSNT